MRRPIAAAECAVPNCWRYAKKGFPFCARCWGLLDENERAGCWLAGRAPFWAKRWSYGGDMEGWPHGSFACAEMEFKINHGQLYCGGLTPGAVLAEFEARTTLAAMAHLCWIRTMSMSREGRVILANRGIEPQERPT